MSQGDSVLTMRIVAPGISTNKKINISKIELGNFMANLDIKENLQKKETSYRFMHYILTVKSIENQKVF